MQSQSADKLTSTFEQYKNKAIGFYENTKPLQVGAKVLGGAGRTALGAINFALKPGNIALAGLGVLTWSLGNRLIGAIGNTYPYTGPTPYLLSAWAEAQETHSAILGTLGGALGGGYLANKAFSFYKNVSAPVPSGAGASAINPATPSTGALANTSSAPAPSAPPASPTAQPKQSFLKSLTRGRVLAIAAGMAVGGLAGRVLGSIAGWQMGPAQMQAMAAADRSTNMSGRDMATAYGERPEGPMSFSGSSGSSLSGVNLGATGNLTLALSSLRRGA